MARNKYPDRCYECGLIVAPNTGHFERYQGRWRTKHANVAGHGRITCEMARASPPKVKTVLVFEGQEIEFT